MNSRAQNHSKRPKIDPESPKIGFHSSKIDSQIQKKYPLKAWNRIADKIDSQGPVSTPKGHVQIRQFMTNLAILVICRWTFQFKNKKTNFFFFGAFFQFGELFER